MPLTNQQKQTLLARSSTLRERLSGAVTPPPSSASDTTAIARRARWCQITTKGDLKSFEKLLTRRNINLNDLDCLLSQPQWQAQTPLPEWIDTIDAVITQASQAEPASFDTAARKTPDLCIEPFYAPFYAVARKKLELALPTNAFNVSSTAHHALRESLKQALHFVCKSALDVQWAVYQVKHSATKSQNFECCHLHNFWTELRKPEQLTDFLTEYSVAARAAATLMNRWQDNTLELIQRLTSDAKAIETRFLDGMPLGELVQVECNLSDPHNKGRSVMRLHFASGLRLIYKPRCVELDLAYNALLDWLELHAAPHPLGKPLYLARTNYAWIEQVDHAPCESQEQLLQFCKSAGALLCLSYLLDATDLHDSNLIAVQTTPFLVDLETLLQPRLAQIQCEIQQDALRKAATVAERSILRTGLLPSLKLGADGTVADVGCLGGLFNVQSTQWYRHEPTASPLSDAMRQDIATGALCPMGLADKVAEGFTQTYQFLIHKRRELLHEKGPLQLFNHKPVRFLLRDTSLYVRLLKPSLSTLCLREGLDRSIALESLYRLTHARPTCEGLEAMIEEEIAALEALDIPLLLTSTGQTTLQLFDGKQSAGVFEQASYEAMLERFHGFSDADLSQQLDFLYGAFAARAANANPNLNHVTTQPEIQKPSDAITPSEAPNTTTHLSAAVNEIVMALHHKAIIGDDGSVTWMSPVSIPRTRFFRFDMVPLNMQSGVLGIAFFLAAYSHTTGDKAAGVLARRAAQTVIQRLGSDGATPIAGIGSMMYALHRIGIFLNDAEIDAAAYRLAQQLTNWRETWLNSPGGAHEGSELCLALLALDKTQAALALGQTLFEGWSLQTTEQKSVATLGAPHLALCWSRLYQTSNLAYFQGACTESVLTMHEASKQDPALLENLHFALLGCQHSLSNAPASFDALLADQFDALRLSPLAVSDHLQNGKCSAAERLLTASRILKQPKLSQAAQQIICQLAQQAQSSRGFQTVAGMPRGTFFPSFNQGFSGIGYTLLRHQINPTLPCVQLWD